MMRCFAVIGCCCWRRACERLENVCLCERECPIMAPLWGTKWRRFHSPCQWNSSAKTTVLLYKKCPRPGLTRVSLRTGSAARTSAANLCQSHTIESRTTKKSSSGRGGSARSWKDRLIFSNKPEALRMPFLVPKSVALQSICRTFTKRFEPT